MNIFDFLPVWPSDKLEELGLLKETKGGAMNNQHNCGSNNCKCTKKKIRKKKPKTFGINKKKGKKWH